MYVLYALIKKKILNIFLIYRPSLTVKLDLFSKPPVV